ncbi:hypothetical protein WS75_16255 [Burkholderia sp. FL-7-2-10-S1-D7]|nr:hypothetical protein WS75_16255 [Burkholderia sp. FL-7-2-10-S1-D7]
MAKVCIRHVNISVAGLTQPETQVNIVIGHFKIFIEATDLPIAFCTHDEAGRGNSCNFVRELGAPKISEFVSADTMMHVPCDCRACKYNTAML